MHNKSRKDKKIKIFVITIGLLSVVVLIKMLYHPCIKYRYDMIAHPDYCIGSICRNSLEIKKVCDLRK